MLKGVKVLMIAGALSASSLALAHPAARIAGMYPYCNYGYADVVCTHEYHHYADYLGPNHTMHGPGCGCNGTYVYDARVYPDMRPENYKADVDRVNGLYDDLFAKRQVLRAVVNSGAPADQVRAAANDFSNARKNYFNERQKVYEKVHHSHYYY